MELLPPGRGGGKRGRAAAAGNAQRGVLRDLRESIEIVAARIVSHPVGSPALANVGRACEVLMAITKEALTEMLNGLGRQRLTKLSTVCNSRASVNARCALLSEILFENQLEALDEITGQSHKAQGALTTAIIHVMTTHFGDEAANISWVAFGELVAQGIHNSGVQLEQERAASAML